MSPGPLRAEEVCGEIGPRTREGAPRCVKAPHTKHEKHRADESWERTLGAARMVAMSTEVQISSDARHARPRRR